MMVYPHFFRVYFIHRISLDREMILVQAQDRYIAIDRAKEILTELAKGQGRKIGDYILNEVNVAPKCEGCIYDYPAQKDHMGLNGCLNSDTEKEPPGAI